VGEVDLASEALHLLRVSSSRWRTLRARGREWRATALATEAWRAQLERRRSEGERFGLITLRSTSPQSPRPGELEQQWALWIAEPWTRATFAAGRGTVDVVFYESTWWSNGNGMSRTNGGAPNSGHGKGPGEHLVATATYALLLEVEEVTEGSRLGRATLEAKVTVRRGLPRLRGRGLHGLVIGEAEEIHLAIDRDRGVILHVATSYHGSVYRIVEMNDVAFDEPFPAGTLDIAPLPGLEWQGVR
jgi:hypothetical protein